MLGKTFALLALVASIGAFTISPSLASGKSTTAESGAWFDTSSNAAAGRATHGYTSNGSTRRENRVIARNRVLSSQPHAVLSGTARWKVEPVPSPVNRTEAELTSVSCPAQNFCLAVGYSFPQGSGFSTLVESWNGSTWSIISSPNVSGYSNQLFGVSCISATNCQAVGNYNDPAGDFYTLVESWNGSAMSIVKSPNSANGHGELYGVSCVSSTFCAAVGDSTRLNNTTLVETWNGASWSLAPSPSPGTISSFLQAVSCVQTTQCTAAGGYSTTGPLRTLVEVWNGTAWSVVASPNKGKSSTSNLLAGVSCASANACEAVGSSGKATLVESWDGSTWSVVKSPNPSSLARFNGVSCVSATNCKAVGSFRILAESMTLTLVESWNGRTWSVSATPDPAAFDDIPDGDLRGDSCSISGCQAVGTTQSAVSDVAPLAETGP